MESDPNYYCSLLDLTILVNFAGYCCIKLIWSICIIRNVIKGIYSSINVLKLKVPLGTVVGYITSSLSSIAVNFYLVNIRSSMIAPLCELWWRLPTLLCMFLAINFLQGLAF